MYSLRKERHNICDVLPLRAKTEESDASQAESQLNQDANR
jgi:hypothetical protein